MPRFSYPHVIDDGAGERLTFLRRVPGRTGDRLEGENLVAPGAGPIMHVHHYQEEALTVRRGRMGYQRLGEAERFAGPGETVVFAPGEMHRFWNAGDEFLACDAHIEPADNVEYFLAEIFDSRKRNGGERPSMLEVAWLARRYRSEYAVGVVPALAQKLLFPLLVLVGTMLGRYDRYADAPEPVVR